MNDYVKPPIGLKPKVIHDLQRINEIKAAMWRYVDAKKPIPVEWVEEYNSLIKLQTQQGGSEE